MAEIVKADSVSEGAPEDRIKQTRSPSYPSMPLHSAIEKARLLYAKGKKFPLPLANAASAMEYGAKSSSFSQAIATMRAFGLVDVTGTGEDRKIVVSERGQKILLDHRDKHSLIQEAALLPTIFRELWDRFYTSEDGLAPDEAMEHYLRWDRPEATFTESVIAPLIGDFKETVGFAKLESSAILSSLADSISDMKRESEVVKVGSRVLWTSQGVAQFPTAREVIRIDEHDGEKFLCVLGDDGKEGWFPMNQATLEASDPIADKDVRTSRPTPPWLNPPANRAQQAGTIEEVFAVGERRIVVQFPTSLSGEEYQDVEDWLPILARKIKRCVKNEN